MASNYWLMKAEPDSRIVKGKDVKFSVDDFQDVGTTAWEGVRNHEAKNLMKSMKVGDQVLFYHSNCKTPGIAGFAEVSKEAYLDHTAWDASHPYFDPKSDADAPKWFMVDVAFHSRAAHFVPLSFLRSLAASSAVPSAVEYIGTAGLAAIKSMALVNRGRLSVQRVERPAWDAITLLAERGGWEEKRASAGGDQPTKAAQAKKSQTKGKKRQVAARKVEQGGAEEDGSADGVIDAEGHQTKEDGVGEETSRTKRKAAPVSTNDESKQPPLRRSTRRK